jgi:non-specific serine/threonine protein kinase
MLVQSAGEIVTKDTLMGCIWPGATVEENTLQVHISAIRKALGRDRDLLRTVSSRGYRLLGDWTIQHRSTAVDPVEPAPTLPLTDQPFQTNLPFAASELIGRAAAVQRLRDLLSAYRAVTLTGPGDIGKTALALEVARSLTPSAQGDAWFIELAPRCWTRVSCPPRSPAF